MEIDKEEGSNDNYVNDNDLFIRATWCLTPGV